MQFLKFGKLTLAASDGVNSFEENSGYNFAEQSIATGKPILQGMGETLAEVTLNIVLRQALNHDITGIVGRLQAQRASGNPERLVLASGVYQGDFVVTGISTSIVATTANGEILSADLSLNLKEYADRVVISQRNVETRPSGTKSNRKVTER